MIVFGLDIENLEYCYSVWMVPGIRKKGFLFDKNHLLLDPYAKAVSDSEYGGRTEIKGAYRARVVSNNFEWNDATSLGTPMCDSVIYEMHVRGFTMDPSSGVKCREPLTESRKRLIILKRLELLLLS